MSLESPAAPESHDETIARLVEEAGEVAKQLSPEVLATDKGQELTIAKESLGN